jgi:hypothetical protein
VDNPQVQTRRTTSEEEMKEMDEKPYRDAGYPAGPVSMGGGRKITSYSKTCPKSQDGHHHYTAVSCIQSVEHFVCDDCGDSYYD